MKLLILESSTTSAKAMLFDSETMQQKIVSRPYGFAQNSNGTHDGEEVFCKTASLAKEISSGTSVDMILQGTTWHSLIVCAKDGTPMSLVELWSYTKASDLCAKLNAVPGFAKNYYKNTGCLVNSSYPYFKLMKKKEDAALPKDCRIGGQGVYNTFRLTGKWVTTLSMASGSGLINIDTRSYDKDLLSKINVSESQLPRIADYTETFPLTKEGAALLGQKEGIPVVPAYPDGALNQIGSGALEQGIMSFSVGTSAAIRITAKKKLLPAEPSLWSYFVLSSHLLGGATSGACNCQDWFKQKFFPEGTTYKEIESRLSHTRDTPVFLPFLFGERCPGWNEKRTGGFLCVRPEHNVFDLYQAVLEGILFNVYQCYEILVKTAGEPDVIKLSGGILHSDIWTQMCADLFGKKMSLDMSDQSSVMGCAVIGMHLTGKLNSPADFRPAIGKTVEPNMEVHEAYIKKFQKYLELYKK
ncbi:hypothetical protein HRI96_01165 [Treponema parvum]|uniref:Gluconokinase n=1 Tax=Treponema parvum TaxID=138851 RepID=A0A975EY01_9SPIR|nr:FGGY-family carbohydrate kinase [Treponema parvum]QTQ10923.1 hypothetical protein HRI96_01165 [Treponema parvum]